jgi:Kef-type K+ transport system membrane component KefB
LGMGQIGEFALIVVKAGQDLGVTRSLGHDYFARYGSEYPCR